jgi:hypothetical protein
MCQKRREVVAISDLTPTRYINRILEKMALAQNNVASQRKEPPIATALTGKGKLQSLGRKKLLSVQKVKKGLIQLAHQYQLLQPLLHQQRRRQQRGKKLVHRIKKVPLAELEVRYTTMEQRCMQILVMTVTMKTMLPRMKAIDDIQSSSKIVTT